LKAQYRDVIVLAVIGALLVAFQGYWLGRSETLPGTDPGSWLAYARKLTGESNRLSAGTYPPLAIGILRGMLLIADAITALRALAVLGFVSTGLGFFVACRLLGVSWPAAAVAGAVFATSAFHQEVILFGGYPELLGLGFFTVALAALDRWLRDGCRRFLAIGASCTALTALTHHLLTGIFPLFAALLCTFELGIQIRRWRTVVYRSAAFAGVAILLALPAVPIYLEMLGLIDGRYVGDGRSSGFQLLQSVPAYLFKYNVLAGIILILAHPAALWLRRNSKGIALAATWSVGTLLALAILGEPRVYHLLVTVACLTLAFGVDAVRDRLVQATTPKQRMNAIVAAILILYLSGWIVWNDYRGLSKDYQPLLQRYTVLSISVADGLDWLRLNTPPSSIVAATLSNDSILGWWVEGYARRRCIYQANLRWLIYGDEKHWAQIANRMLGPGVSLDTLLESLADNPIDYILVHKGYLADPNPCYTQSCTLEQRIELSNAPHNRNMENVLAQLVADGRLEAVFENEGVLIYRATR
jgi:hypothetical protein